MTDDSLGVTNPFRRSMLLRSESPFDEGAAGYGLGSGLTHTISRGSGDGPLAQQTGLSSSQSVANPLGQLPAPHALHQRLSSANSSTSSLSSSNNPFRASIVSQDFQLQDPRTTSNETSDYRLAPPPSYWEAGGRRHSDPGSRADSSTPSSYESASEEKQRLAEERRKRDRIYREGYEQGLRRAERERREPRGDNHESSERRDRDRERERERRHRERERERGAAGSVVVRQSHSGRSSLDDDDYKKEKAAVNVSSSEYPHRRANRNRSKSESVATQSKHRSSRKHKGVPGPSLDVIDKLDVTGLFGPGSFHHDGPFDACTPARNKVVAQPKPAKGGTSSSNRPRAPPIQAFQVDGPNNSLSALDPGIERYIKEEEVYGRADLSMAPPEAVQQSFNPKDVFARIHGQSSLGLGSSTFLDGTRASQKAIAEAGKEKTETLGRSRSILRRNPSTRNAPVPSRSASTVPDDSAPPQGSGFLNRVKSLRVKR